VIPHRQRPVAEALNGGDAVREDFRNFLYLMWKWLRLPAPTEMQYDIASYLQHGPARLMVEAFRGVGKSWITAAFVLWCLYREPNERVMVVSASKDRADAFAVFVKRCIAEWDLLSELRPEPGMRDSNVTFDVGGSMPHQSASLRSIGITGQMTGGRASIIVADDIETPKNSQTQIQRDRLSELVKEFDAILMTDEDLKSIGLPRARVVYLGTPQTEMSLYNALPQRGYALRVWPARYPRKGPDFKGTLEAYVASKYQDRLAPIIQDRLFADPEMQWTPTDAKRFTELDLRAREASYGRSGFALQFQLDTSLSDADRYPLKCSDAMIMGLSPQMAPVKLAWGSGPECLHTQPAVGLAGDRWHRPMYVSKDYADYQGVVMAIDPSGRGADETAYAVVAMAFGFLFVLECGGLQGGYDDSVLKTLAEIAKRNCVKKIVIEANFGGGMFTKLFTPWLTKVSYPCTTEDITSSIQKEKRIIDTLEPVFNQHRIVFSEKLVEEDARTEDLQYQLFHQLTRITREKGALGHDDRLDALSMAVAHWAEVMDKDVAKNEDEHRQRMLDQELSSFFGTVFGVEPAPLNWMGDLR
jgi:hypothetical protein